MPEEDESRLNFSDLTDISHCVRKSMVSFLRMGATKGK
jgi:hypothetical protein